MIITTQKILFDVRPIPLRLPVLEKKTKMLKDFTNRLFVRNSKGSK